MRTFNFHFEAKFFPATGAIKPWEIWSVDNATGALIARGGSYKTQKSAQASVDRNHKIYGITVAK